MRLLGEHAHNRFTRPHLRGHRAGRAWTTCFRTERPGRRGRRPAPLGQRRGRRAEPAVRAREPARRRPARPLRPDQRRARAVLPRRARGRAAGRPTTSPRSWTSPAGTSASGRRSGTRSPTGCGCARRAAAGPGLDAATMCVLGTPRLPADRRRGARRPRRVERQLRAAGRAGRRHAAPPSAAASCSSPARSCCAEGDAYSTPWVYVAAAADGLDGLAAAWHTWQRSLPTHPSDQPVVLNVWEAVFFDHDLDPAARHRRPGRQGRGRAVRPRRRLVPAPPRRHRRPRRLVGRRDGVAATASTRSSSTCAAWGWSSGCGSSPRWSTPTPTCSAQHPEWVARRRRTAAAAGAAPAGPRPDPRRGAWSTSSSG